MINHWNQLKSWPSLRCVKTDLVFNDSLTVCPCGRGTRWRIFSHVTSLLPCAANKYNVQSCSFLCLSDSSSSLLSLLCLPKVKKFYSVPNNFMYLPLVDFRCGWEPDGSWWVHHRGEADWDVVEAPGCWWRSWSCFKDLHRAPGQTQSHDAGKLTKSSLNKSHFKSQSFTWTENCMKFGNYGNSDVSHQLFGSLGTGQVCGGSCGNLSNCLQGRWVMWPSYQSVLLSHQGIMYIVLKPTQVFLPLKIAFYIRKC